MTLTVPEAARRIGKNPETVRRWIRSGKLRSTKVGTQHTVAEEDLEAVTRSHMLPLPKRWQKTFYGRPTPDVVAWIDRSRAGH